MFSSNQDVDYSLNRPCRCLSAVAPPSSSSKPSPSKPAEEADGGDGGGGDDDYLETASFASHRFLAGSAIPSVSKLGGDGGDGGDANNILEEEDDERTNRLYLLQYHEDSNELTQERSWVHPSGEVWAMACHPTRGEWAATCGGGAVFSAAAEGEAKKEGAPLTKFQTTLWRISEMGEGGGDEDEFDGEGSALASGSKLEPVVTIPHGDNCASTTGWEQRVGQILWSPLLSPSNSSGDALYDLADASSSDGGGNLITVGWDAQSPISLWDISSLSDVKEVWSTGGGGVASSRRGGRNRFAKLASMHSALPRRVSWDPHDTHSILATAGVDVVAYDMRAPASSGAGVIRSAHRYGVADVCHNHLQTNVVVTAGMDGVMKFWDLRMHLSNGLEALAGSGCGQMPPPLLKAVRGGHSHWTTRALYNPSYDQLVLSGGSDGIANLWRISSCSSAPLLDLDDDDEADADEGSFDDDEMEGEDGEEKLNAEEDEQEGWAEDDAPTPTSDDGDEYDKEDKGKASRNESSASDIRVTRFECSDVTADLAWSASDPWIYATMSSDGAVVVHHVPSKEKYKILL